MTGSPSSHLKAEATAKKLKALITGASRGIGYSVAKHFQEIGIETLTPSRQEMDLASPRSIEGYLASVRDAGVNILVNNAGINALWSLGEMPDAEWAAMMQTNLTAPMQLIRGLAPGMQAQGWGRVVNISSVFSLVTKEKRAAYSATKSGLNGLTRTAAVELSPHGILVNSVCPGYIDTELTHKNNSPADLARIVETIPARRMAQPEEIARFVGFLCSRDNTYITGQSLVIDGGFSCK